MEDAPRDEHPNWLVCSSCSAPIVTASELIAEEVSVLRNAVYAYQLDMLDREVTVYSAMNTADHRFDVVRAQLKDEAVVPPAPSALMDERESLRLFLRHFQVVSLGEREAALDNPNQLVEELDRLMEQSNTTSQEGSEDESGQDADNEEESPPKRRRIVTDTICDRIETKFEEPTDEYSWFPSYSWTIASCLRCHEHLGWVFWQLNSGEWEREFISLIVTRLREKFISS
jgi:hypothetical protein